ncbi:hypothetical protein B0T18DRAFT_420294 [Schizothecium vesticola]|uniref:Uncharacterized protein n=1 Tax=Schizothecium vesticola TaxID=314040 RepID=A0AA40ELI6_9PEZI|nr:hypothetical protein B0T18DRAFT_420294 [Schizothecium vesticola]
MSSCSSLSGFPPELLLKTFEYLCDHCHDEHDTPVYSRTTFKGKASLLNLSLASKQMSAMAAPILHHNLPPLDVNKACQLLSNLLSKPHLADNIYKAKLDATIWYAQRTLGQQRVINTLLERLELDPWDPYSSKGRDGSVSDGSDMEDDEGMDDEDDDEEGGEKANDNELPVLDEMARAEDEEAIAKFYCAAIRELVTRARNLQELEITNTMEEETEDGADRWSPDEYEDAAWQRLIADPAALANLRRLEINHWDTEGGFSLNDTEPTLASVVLAAAGNLERLSVQLCEGISLDRSFPSITAVELWSSCFTSEDLETLIVSLPALREFQYDSGGDVVSYEGDEHTPADVVRLLGLRSATLTSVSLCYASSAVQEMDQTLLDSFSAFPVLESMDLWAGDVFENSIFPPPTNRLVSILPKSLKRLKVAGSCPARECQSLATAAAAGQFPALEEVTFGRVLGRPAEGQPSYPKIKTDEDFWTPIRDAFQSLKIKCSVEE